MAGRPKKKPEYNIENGMLIFNNDSIEAGNRLREKFIFVFI